MVKPIFLAKKETMGEDPPLNIEQELLAEIQVYRDKQKQWEASEKSRKYKNYAMGIVYLSFFIYVPVMLIFFFFLSIQPDFHAELAVSFAGAMVLAFLLAGYESLTASLEKKSIENPNFENYKVENDEKAQGLLDRLKQNHEMYQQKLHNEYKTCIRRLVNLVSNLVGFMNVAFIRYQLLENTIVGTIVFYLGVWPLWIFASIHIPAKLDDPDRKFIDWDFYRTMWRREITWEEFKKKMNEPIWPENKKS